MTIYFHCEHCGKKIAAPKKAGGKRGKCPACRNSVYVPQEPDDDGDDLKLAPLDTDLEQTRRQLLAETFALTQDILNERSVPETPSDEPGGGLDPNVPFIPSVHLSPGELRKTVQHILCCMADDRLDDAESEIALLDAQREEALKVLDEIALAEIPDPELAAIPAHVLSGLIRTLRGRLA